MADPTTQSNFQQIASTHVSFEWTLDFSKQVLHGSATHQLTTKQGGVTEAIFDTSDLDIHSVQIEGKAAPFLLEPKHEVMGSALRIVLPTALNAGQGVVVKITYRTTTKCSALQWLSKEQTQGKRFPYLFSQCQPNYARALAPLQDTPSVKITYSAEVTSILPVLLSAIRISPSSDGLPHDGREVGKDTATYSYNQPVPIPSYLIAIASGNVCYRPFSGYGDKQWKCGIWAEPELIDSAYWEFCDDTAKFLAAEEKIVTPYKFGVYDLLVLPPSFPFGGMENACLSFLTPTLLTGDRTLVDVVVHELTHSWFGNGVTAHACHFWLNEGWTTYMERVLQQMLYSPAERGFSYLIGSKALSNALKEYEDRPKYQRLVIEFEYGEDPDDAYSSVPYEKGANFLLYLEQILGGLDVFLPYVQDYVKTFMGKTVMTPEWKDHLYDYFEKHGGEEKIKALNGVDWDAWCYGEGLRLPVEMQYDVTLAHEAYTLAERWDASRSVRDVSQLDFKDTDIKNFKSNQVVVFLERLQTYPPLSSAHLTHLAYLYSLSTTPNAEIRLRFYELALQDPKSEAAATFADEASKWVVGNDGTGIVKGRMKFCRPVFRAISKVDHELAVKVFGGSKDSFHPIARKMIEKDLGIAELI